MRSSPPLLHDKLTLSTECGEGDPARVLKSSPFCLLGSVGWALSSVTSGFPGAGGSIKSIHTDASSLLGQTTKALVNLWEFNPSLALNNNQRRS